jgi:hypothetical protein
VPANQAKRTCDKMRARACVCVRAYVCRQTAMHCNKSTPTRHHTTHLQQIKHPAVSGGILGCCKVKSTGWRAVEVTLALDYRRRRCLCSFHRSVEVYMHPKCDNLVHFGTVSLG